jgi:hypothetical protein
MYCTSIVLHRLIVQNANHRDSRLDEAWSSSTNNKTHHSNDLTMYQLSDIADHNDEGKEEDTLRRNKTPPRKGKGVTTPSDASTSRGPINATTSDGSRRTKNRKKKKVKKPKQREGRDTKQNAVAMLTLSDVVVPPSSTSIIRVPDLSEDEEERPGAIAMPGPPRSRDRQQIAVPVEEPPIEATAFLVVEEGGVTNEARGQIAAEERHQEVLQQACIIATNVVPPPAEEEEEARNDFRSLKPSSKKLACVVVVMLVVILGVVLGVLLGRRKPDDTDDTNDTDEPTDPLDPYSDIDFTNGFCEDQPAFHLNGNMMPLFPQYTDVRNNQKNCPLRLTKECVTLTSASAYLELDLCNMYAFSTTFTYEISADNEDGCYDLWGADGLAFVIHQDIRGVQALGGGGANLGVYDVGGVGGTANALVIEMDPWNNAIIFQAAFLDNLYEQIHVITTDSQGKLTERYEAQCDGPIHSEPRTVVVSYDGSHMTINHSGCTATYFFPLDLNSIFDGPRVYMGFAGATGPVTSTQEIWSWSFRQECF